MKLRPYPEYKDSGVLWLEAIPKHWDVISVKRLFSIQLGKMLQGTQGKADEQRVHYLKAQHVQWFTVRTSDLPTMWASPGEVMQFGVRPGDLLVCEGGEGGRCGIVKQLLDPCIIQNALHRVRPTGTGCIEYLQYVMSVVAATGWFTAINNKATIAHFTREKFGALGIPVPPSHEQEAIAAFLAHANHRINRLIRAKRRLIELLNEQKQAVIHQAVTRGLDPNVHLKPSGIDWLDDVPAHWKITKLKYVAEVQTGITLGKNYGSTLLEKRPYLRVANVQNGYLDLTNIATVRIPNSEIVACELRRGDVLMTEGGDIDKLGRGCIWRGEIPSCLHQNHIFAVRVNRRELLPEFLVVLMTSRHGRIYFQKTAKQTTNLASTNSTTLKAFPIHIPAIDEQQDLLESIAQASASLDVAIFKAQREIDLLREYRTRLIADVVTGKLDVRAVELPTLDEVDTLDNLDIDKDIEAEEMDDIEEVVRQ